MSNNKAQDKKEVSDSKKASDKDLMNEGDNSCLLYTSQSPRDRQKSRMPSSA